MVHTLTMARINRFSCKCKLCKMAWTTELTDRTAAYNAHAAYCFRYQEVFAGRQAVSILRMREEDQQYQMAALFFTHRQIEGRYVADKKCDGRCIHATGHNCECQCGGKNHGLGAAA